MFALYQVSTNRWILESPLWGSGDGERRWADNFTHKGFALLTTKRTILIPRNREVYVELLASISWWNDPVATFLISNVSCVSLFGTFLWPPSGQRECVFSPRCVSSRSCFSTDQHLRPQRPIIVSWAPRSVLRGGVPGKTSSQNERWGKLGHEFRSFHPKLFTLTDISAHRDGRGRGSVCFLSDPLWLSISTYWCHFFRL